MSKFQQKDYVITQRINNVIYELLVKTRANMVYVDDITTLTEVLDRINRLLESNAQNINSLSESFQNLFPGSDPCIFKNFAEVWNYVNVNGDPKSELIRLIESKQSSEEGKGLSSNDFTDILLAKLNNTYEKEEVEELIEDKVQELGLEIDTKIDEVKSDVNGLTTRVNTAETNISSNAHNIGELSAKPNIPIGSTYDDVKDNLKDGDSWYKIVN